MKYFILPLIAVGFLSTLLTSFAHAGMYCYMQDGRTICCITNSKGNPISCQ